MVTVVNSKADVLKASEQMLPWWFFFEIVLSRVLLCNCCHGLTSLRFRSGRKCSLSVLISLIFVYRKYLCLFSWLSHWQTLLCPECRVVMRRQRKHCQWTSMQRKVCRRLICALQWFKMCEWESWNLPELLLADGSVHSLSLSLWLVMTLGNYLGSWPRTYWRFALLEWCWAGWQRSRKLACYSQSKYVLVTSQENSSGIKNNSPTIKQKYNTASYSMHHLLPHVVAAPCRSWSRILDHEVEISALIDVRARVFEIKTFRQKCYSIDSVVGLAPFLLQHHHMVTMVEFSRKE